MSDLPPPPPHNWLPPAPAPPPPPPGYQAYGPGSQGAYAAFQHVRKLAKALVVLVAVTSVFNVVGALLQVLLSNKADDFLAGRISEDDFLKSTILLGLLSAPGGLTYMAAIVLTMIWMSRMASNLRTAGRVGRWSPGWAIGGWFLPPMVIYVIPWLMFGELWRGSDSQNRNDPGWNKAPVDPIIHLWWVLYGLAPLAFLGQSLSQFNFGTGASEQAERLSANNGVVIAQGFVGLVAGVVYIVLIRKLSRRHQQFIYEPT